MTCLGSLGSTAMSLTMFLYAAFVAPDAAEPAQLEPAGTSTEPPSSLICGIQLMLGAKAKVQAAEPPPAPWYQMPRLVAAKTTPEPGRMRPMVVDSSSLPPTRSPGAKLPVRGLPSWKTPAPT